VNSEYINTYLDIKYSSSSNL